jgi:hypothetical protein
VVLATACSGDTTTKAEFVGKAVAICDEANARARALGPEPPILTPAHATWLVALTESDIAALDRLQELDRPPSDLATIGTVVTELRGGLAYDDRIARASRAHDEPVFRAAVAAALKRLTAGQLAAADYGLEECSQLGLVTRAG